MFAKLLTAFTVASVGGVVGYGVIQEAQTKPAPVKSAPAIVQAPPVIQVPPVLGQGPPPPGNSDGTPLANTYAAAYPGWKFWTVQVPGATVPATSPRKAVKTSAGWWTWMTTQGTAQGIRFYAYGTPGPYGLPWGSAGMQLLGADAGGQYWVWKETLYPYPFTGVNEDWPPSP